MGTKPLKVITEGYRLADLGNFPTRPADPALSITSPEHVTALPRRKMFRQLPYGHVPTHAPLHVDSNDVNSQIGGLVQRMGRTVPKPNANLVLGLEAYVGRFLKGHLQPLVNQPLFKDWLEAAPYTQARKLELEDVYNNLHGGPPSRKQRRKIASFIKTENYPKYKHARWINSRSDAFKAYSGPWFSAIEKVVFKLPWFIKYVPVPDRAALIAKLRTYGKTFLGTDFESYEAHMTPKIMKAVELQLYSYMLSNYPEVSKLICDTIAGSNHGRTRRGVGFRLKGRRMSGDMCTSLGNGFTNLMLWLYLAEIDGFDVAGYVEGDDGIFAVSGAPAPAVLADQFKALGFTIKIESGDDPCTMSFCGIVSADGQNIRNPSEYLDSFGWTSSCLDGNAHTMLQLQAAKAMSAAYELPHCPILRAIADRALALSNGVEPRFVLDGYHVPPPRAAMPAFAPTAGTRKAFSDLYHVEPDMQIEIEQRISKSCDLNFLVDIFPAHPDVAEFAAFNLTGT